MEEKKKVDLKAIITLIMVIISAILSTFFGIKFEFTVNDLNAELNQVKAQTKVLERLDVIDEQGEIKIKINK